jgi:hypothetical protein
VNGQVNNFLVNLIEGPGSFFLSTSERIRNVYDFLPNYDIIVVGSGSAGSVVAKRLSENRNWTVLLLEAGPDEPFVSEIPLSAAIVATIKDVNWNYKTARQPHACLGMKNVCKS